MRIKEHFTRRRGREVRAGYSAFFGVVEGPMCETERTASNGAVVAAEKALTGTYEPTLTRIGDQFCVVYRTPSGWYTSPIRKLDEYKESTGGWPASLSGSGPYDSREEAEAYAAYGMAQIAWSPDLSDEECYRLLAHVHRVNRYEFGRWIAWQRAYAQHRRDGFSDMECHSFACKHDEEFNTLDPNRDG